MLISFIMICKNTTCFNTDINIINSKLEKIAQKTYKPHTKYKELLDLNIKVQKKINPNEKLAIIKRVEGSNVVYSLGHNNFYTITRYNRSRLYALAVHTLAEEIKIRSQ